MSSTRIKARFHWGSRSFFRVQHFSKISVCAYIYIYIYIWSQEKTRKAKCCCRKVINNVLGDLSQIRVRFTTKNLKSDWCVMSSVFPSFSSFPKGTNYIDSRITFYLLFHLQRCWMLCNIHTKHFSISITAYIVINLHQCQAFGPATLRSPSLRHIPASGGDVKDSVYTAEPRSRKNWSEHTWYTTLFS